MLFVRRPDTIIVEDSSALRTESNALAEERGRVSGSAATLGILALVVLAFIVGYFAWWAPSQTQVQVQAPAVQHDTQIIDRTVPGPSTIINNPPVSPPTVIDHNNTIIVPPPAKTSGSDTTSTTSGANDNGGTDAGTTTSGSTGK